MLYTRLQYNLHYRKTQTYCLLYKTGCSNVKRMENSKTIIVWLVYPTYRIFYIIIHLYNGSQYFSKAYKYLTLS